MRLRPIPTALALLLTAASASAGFTNPFVPSFRGLPGTEYGAWDVFDYEHTTANLPDQPGATTVDAGVVQLDTSAILVGGNIYSFLAPIDVRLTDSVPSDLKELYLAVSTKGNELDYAGVVLTYVDAQGATQVHPPSDVTTLASTVTGMGVDVETLFHWDLAAEADEILAYELVFKAAAMHTSLDAVTLDTRTAEFVTTYCTAKVNSQGCTPAIGWSGLPSASSSEPFLITATGILPNTVGVLVYGTSGPLGLPFQGGFLCVAAPKRTGGFGSGGAAPCSGAFAYDFNALVQSGQGIGLAAGVQVQAQFWSRDTGFAPPNASSLTDALEFTILD